MKFVIALLLTTTLTSEALAEILRQPSRQSFIKTPFERVSKAVKTINYANGTFSSRLTPVESNTPSFKPASHRPLLKSHQSDSIRLEQLSPTQENHYNLYYTASVYMGSTLEEVTSIVFDTGSSWLVMETIDCTDCISTYDYSANTVTYNELPDTDMTQSYADGTSISGTVAIDWVCLQSDTDTCVTDFPWMNVQEIGLGDDLNGIMGMCADPTAISDDIAPNYIQYLYDQEIIAS